MESNDNIVAEKEKKSTKFKRSSRVKKSKKFFDEEASVLDLANPNKLKEKVLPKGKTNKKPSCGSDQNVHESSLCVPEEKNLESMDDEDLWLEALEKGELDDNGEIPKTRDPSLMTARQRALMNRSSSNLVEEIIPALREETEEERRKRMEKNRKRKLQAVKKAKETQKQTIRKLIEIPKSSKEKQKTTQTGQNNKPTIPMIKYVNNVTTCYISYPEGYEFPLAKDNQVPQLKTRFCLICGEKRRYSCSKTNVSLCSMKCYKENLNRSAVLTS